MWTEMIQRSLLRVFPNGSRVDSSNFSPLEFWNSGVPMGKAFSSPSYHQIHRINLDPNSIQLISVALNFQTPGLMMDLYDGKFRQNGGCGYVLKPAMMRQPGYSVPSSLRETAPISPPQLLRIRVWHNADKQIGHKFVIVIMSLFFFFFATQVISGQQLPRPRGSAAKATVVDPYVLIQIYGIPIDCAGK